MKSMREKYFENYEKIQTPAKNGRGFRTEYRYKGFWYGWDMGARDLKKQKARFIMTELLSALLLFTAAFRSAELNTVRITAGFAAISMIPWIAEIWGVFRFSVTKSPMTVSDFDEIRNCITVGSVVRAILLVISMAAGIVAVLRTGHMGMENVFVCAGHLLSAAASILILRWYTSLRYSIFRNENGKKGQQI